MISAELTVVATGFSELSAGFSELSAGFCELSAGFSELSSELTVVATGFSVISLKSRTFRWISFEHTNLRVRHWPPKVVTTCTFQND